MERYQVDDWRDPPCPVCGNRESAHTTPASEHCEAVYKEWSPERRSKAWEYQAYRLAWDARAQR